MDKRDALDALQAADSGYSAAWTHLLYAVRDARSAGATWADIGATVGTTKQGAWERWSEHLSELAD